MTQRSIDDLYSRFPDNTSGQISPADMRDAVDSLQLMIAKYDLQTQVETTLVQNTWKKLEGITALDPQSFRWSMPQNNRIQYDGIVPCRGTATGLVVLSGANTTTVELGIYINGVLIPDTVQAHEIISARERDAIIMRGSGNGNPDDYFELWVRNLTDSTSVTAIELSLDVNTGTA